MNIISMMILSLLFSLLIYSIFSMQKKNIKSQNFNNPMECGFKNLEKNRSSVSIMMYMNVIMFIMLEMEIIFVMMEVKNSMTLINIKMIMFIIFIMIMTCKEWKKMVMEWFN